MKKEVVIVGGGPAGLATAACLNVLKIPNIVLEKEDTYAHLWKKKAYDRLKLHLAKEFCALPHMPHADSTPTYIPRADFIKYLDGYIEKFDINPVCNTLVQSASYDGDGKIWKVKTKNLETGDEGKILARFLVVATWENALGFVPEVEGLKEFKRDVVHSSEFKSGKSFCGKRVLVVGCGNSGMEIAYDLASFAAKTSISIRSPVISRDDQGVNSPGHDPPPYLPIKLVDTLLLMLSWLYYGKLSKYGIFRPRMGPLALKAATGVSTVIDVGTIGKIKTGEIRVVKEPKMVNGDEVVFMDGKTCNFDAIVFATGYRSTAKNWLKDDDGWLLNQGGFPKERFPNHWKGKNGLYCVGLARRGLFGIAKDAESTANDIEKTLRIKESS